MPRVSYAFFIVAFVCGIIGMGMGMAMGATENFTLMPVHAHLNLLGWVSLALMGGFYALAGARASTRLAWINLAVSSLGILFCIPSLALLLLGNKGVVPFLMIGEFSLVGGMLLFGANLILAASRGPRTVAA
ncbi:vacuolar-type H+-ATPase subunit I/STV1 [Caulobacter ginsengisoli]|jgi:hypothetical protein|uniref:Vacuolar-type H+-ATPase subunit I/STV1 n=1 Tax=Caulobacter ginsengisoli TaxID=400775 RepID=A0ABU0ITL9_9CAUL|nr:hypothetical protein [Caulobacter ginsengisoli]MDQ0465351.1 vacuolar-type H+-ATPase subunit I/STV1 [Caulobacter ginsengisoli]